MPRNRTSSDSNQAILQESDCFTRNTDETCQDLHAAALKQLLLQRAWEQWTSKNEKYAIFYQTISFCLQSSSFQENEDIFQYIERLRKELCYSNIDKPIYNENFNDINKYLDKEISTACRQFPKEWTIVQLCKNFNPYALSSKYEDIATFNAGISMTIFKHSAMKDMLMLEIRKQVHLENIFEKVYRLNKMITEHLRPRDDSYSNEEKQTVKEKYWKTSEKIEKYIQEIINLLTAFIGPWICALSGNFKNRKSIETENEIRKKVYEFLCKHDFNEHQKKLIHLVARRTDLLSPQQIFIAITYILREKSNLGYNDIDLNNLYDFITWIKQEYKYEDTSTHPCILIIDEFLDQMPFEMINPHQEYTRMCSFSNLKKMWERHSNSMDSNGYIITTATSCGAIVNPDNSLKSMEERMRNFFNYWLPSWKVIYNQNITKESFYEILSQSDVFVYAGHGSGLNLSFSDSVYTVKTKSTIVLLFGCASAGLTSSGLSSELKGAHYYYHLGSSPSVIGFLWSVTDFHTDVCSTKILSSWIKSTSKPHWQLIDKASWKKNGSLTFSKVCDIVSSESLSEVITKIHTDNDLPISIRASLVYRGLPVTLKS